MYCCWGGVWEVAGIFFGVMDRLNLVSKIIIYRDGAADRFVVAVGSSCFSLLLLLLSSGIVCFLESLSNYSLVVIFNDSKEQTT
jgi:hypothetical protein